MAKCKGYLTDSLYKEFVSHDPEYGVLYWKTRDPNHFRTEGAYKCFNKRCVGYFETIEQAVEARAKVNLQHGFHENHGMR